MVERKEPWTEIAKRNDFAVLMGPGRVCKFVDVKTLPQNGTATFEIDEAGMLYIKFDK